MYSYDKSQQDALFRKFILTCICLIAGCLSGEKSRHSAMRSDVTAQRVVTPQRNAG